MTDCDPLSTAEVIPLHQLPPAAAERLLSRLALDLVWVEAGAEIPGSFWGDSEAGIIGNTLYARADTPVHSLLHESAHLLCARIEGRPPVHTHAGGADVEEHAVCYLQCLLADALEGYSRARCFADMDAWGYHFILGSTQAWFERDAQDAQHWLHARQIIDQGGVLCEPFASPDLR